MARRLSEAERQPTVLTACDYVALLMRNASFSVRFAEKSHWINTVGLRYESGGRRFESFRARQISQQKPELTTNVLIEHRRGNSVSEQCPARPKPGASRKLPEWPPLGQGKARFSRLTNGCAWNAVSAFANPGRAVAHVRGSYVPCVDGSELARAFFRFAALVGAAMCSAFRCGSHDRWP
jgi:hypothetical protein